MNPWLVASLWVGLALVATMFSIRLGISVALVEIGVGVLAGNFLHLTPNEWVSFLAGFGSVLLTFLAGAEIDPDVLRANLKESVLKGHFDLLVVGFMGHSRVFDRIWGGSSQNLTRLAPCSVLLVK